MADGIGFKNIEVLKKAEWCMCYHCVKRFKFKEINEFTDSKKTAMCPKCGVDAVVADLDRDEVVELHDKKFNHGSSPFKIPRETVRIRENVFQKGEEWKK